MNGVEISAGLIGLPQVQRPFGIIAHAGSSLPGLAAPAPPAGAAPGSMLKALLGEKVPESLRSAADGAAGAPYRIREA